MSNPILIATTSQNHIAQAVIGHLQKRNIRVLPFYTDKLLDGSARTSVTYRAGIAMLRHDSWQVSADTIGAAWLWRAVVTCDSEDPLIRQNTEREMRKTLHGIWSTIPDGRWLTPPHRIRDTQNKLVQIRTAHSVGLKTIDTVIGNDWNAIRQLGDIIAFKMPGVGVLETSTDFCALYTQMLTQKDITSLQNHPPFPGMYQTYIEKKHEWRVTIVGNTVFSAIVYTDGAKKDDWRKHSSKGHVRFVEASFPEVIILQCKNLLAQLGLRYGAFDFIETPSGEIYFVEVNSNGQFWWLEKKLGFPISEAIADLLVAIAATSNAQANRAFCECVSAAASASAQSSGFGTSVSPK